MSFERKLSRRYIFAQKRHSILTILSIIAAVTMITVVFILCSTYQATMLDICLRDDPYHAEIYGLTHTQARQVASYKDIAEVKYEKSYDDEEGITRIKFQPDIEDADKSIENALAAANIKSTNSCDGYSLNEELLYYQLIGLDAKADFVQTVACVYVFVLFLIFCSRLVIDTAFEISSKEKERQFGVLQSIGASKKQIIKILMHESSFLSVIGIPVGIGFGILMSYILCIILSNIDGFTSNLAEYDLSDISIKFSVSPVFLLITAVTALGWVWLSAYGTGMRIVKMSPIEAIKGKSGKIKKIKKHSVFSLIFGWTGKLASRNVRRNKKRFAITILSITLSMTLFAAFSYVVDCISHDVKEIIQESDYDFEITITDNSKDKTGIDYKEWYQKLNESKLFKDTNVDLYFFGKISADLLTKEQLKYREDNNINSDKQINIIRFLNEQQYNSAFSENPEISYSELAKQNGYIIMNYAYQIDYDSATFNDGSYDFQKLHKLYNIKDGDTINLELKVGKDNSNNSDGNNKNTENKKIKILLCTDTDNVFYKSYASAAVIIGTEEQYEKLTNGTKVINDNLSIMMNLKNKEDYSKAINFFENNNINYNNYYGTNLRNQGTLLAVKIFGYFIIGLIAVIAIINMVNIISTGILNRKSEIASMKSLGMSKGQLIKITIIESAQYAIVSCIFSIILVELLILLSNDFMLSFQVKETVISLINETNPILSVLISTAATFIVGILASILPVAQIEKISITEAMKNID